MKYWIKGDDNSPQLVIETLERLGGKNLIGFSGEDATMIYYIDEEGTIMALDGESEKGRELLKTASSVQLLKERLVDLRYLRIAGIWAENSYAKRRQVGAIVVKDRMIISDGYNGTPSGFENICEDEEGKTKPYVLHAEANAITKLAKSNNSSVGSTLYITCSPCMECAKLIVQAGIKRVVYSDKYHDMSGVNLLERAGIDVEYMPVKK